MKTQEVRLACGIRGALGVVLMVMASVAWCNSSSADTVTNLHMNDHVDLASYVNAPGMGILVGDKLFGDFTYVTSDSTGTTNNLLPAGAIQLSPLSGMVGFGLEFSAPFFTAGGIAKDFLIGYSVTVTNAAMLISDVHLTYNGAYTGTGFSVVTESAFDAGHNLLGQIDVHNPPPSLSTNFDLTTPQAKLFIKKDILLWANDSNFSTANVSFIDQQFSQVAIPEPSSIMLVITELAGLLIWPRRTHS